MPQSNSWNHTYTVLSRNEVEQLLRDSSEFEQHPSIAQGRIILKDVKNIVIRFLKAWFGDLALHRHVRLRKRYIFTKNNRVRLRYLMGLFLVVATGGILIFSSFDNWDVQRSYASSVEVAPLDEAMREQVEYSKTGDMRFFDTTDIVERITASLRKHLLPTRKPLVPMQYAMAVNSGDTLAGVLTNAGVSTQDAYQAIKSMGKYFDPRLVKPGHEVVVKFSENDEGERYLSRMSLKIDPVKTVVVDREADGEFAANMAEKEVSTQNMAAVAEIETSLYGSALRAGIPVPVVAELIRAYSWDVDFQRDIRRGDRIQVLYEIQKTNDGQIAGYGNVTFANLTVGGHEVPIYRYKTTNGDIDYFGPSGHSIKKTLMKTPIDGARLTSGYGMRKHPVLGYNKMHRGIDFGASLGTPIYAAGDGVIEKMERWSSYGNYVRIRHNSKLKTAYAHMHKFAPGLGAGSRVKQGQVIGYVGSTGRATGAHLHYEVMVNNDQVNPSRVDLPVGEQLKGKELSRFKSVMKSLDQKYASLSEGLKYASNETQDAR